MSKTAFWHVLLGYGGMGLKPEVTEDKKNVRVAALTPGGAAETAGLRVDDLLLSIGDDQIDPANLAGAAEQARGEEGTTVTVTVQRGAQTLQIPVKRQFVRSN